MFFIFVLLLAITLAFVVASLNSYRNEGIYMLCAAFFGFAALFTLEAAANEYSCTKTWNMSNTPSQYSIMTGCMIKIDDKWIPAKNYREFEE